MLHATLAKANDLIAWADRLTSRHELARVVRDLVQISSSGLLELISFPSDEGVQKPGWDGLVRTSGTSSAWVPNGVSAWELGVNTAPGNKASDDYDKRTKDSLGVNIAQSVFIFVTLRRWVGKDEWVRKRNAENQWREVRAYDADELIAWLESAPSAHIRVSQMLGLQPDGALPLEMYWAEWIHATKPPFNSDLVVGGREEARQAVVGRIQDRVSAVTIKGDSSDDALSFLAAVIHRLNDTERDAILSRAIVVDSEATWRRLATITSQTLILIPRFDAGNLIGGAVQNGHHVIVPTGRLEAASSDQITLARPSRDAAEKALSTMGLSRERAASYATLARRSLSALRRRMALAPASLTPDWARDTAKARDLLAPLFADMWNDACEGDRTILARLAAKPYQEVHQTVLQWEIAPDPPFRRVGSVLMVASREDAWRLLGKFITEDDVKRFYEVTLDVLGAHDPTIGMSTSERFLAGMQGNVLSHTSLLRKGIAGSLAIMATLSDCVSFAAAISGADVAGRLVRELLCERGKNDLTLWASLASCLPLLAEAAPVVFLEAVEAGLNGETPVLAGMFQEQPDYYFGGTSPHTYLLWALETLAWNAEYLGRASLCLAKIARLDPGGRTLNRPGHSLRDIFLCWHPHTGATAKKRLAVLEILYRREDAVTWRLMLALLPRGHDTTSGTAKPDWRDWVPESNDHLTLGEIYETTTAIFDRLLELAQDTAKRWLDLITAAPSLFFEQRETFLAKAETLDVSQFTDEEKVQLRDVLRKEIAHHRDFPDAEWAMPIEHLDRLDVFFERLLPSDVRVRHRWVFQPWIPLPERGRHDWDERQRRTWQLRAEALTEIIAEYGLTEAVAFAQHVAEPGLVGETLGRLVLPEEQHTPFLQEHLGAQEPWRDQMASGLIRGSCFAFGPQWIQPRVEAARSAQLFTSSQWGAFFVSVPFGFVPVKDIDAIPKEAQRIFWTHINGVGFPEDPDETDRIVTRLIQFGRPELALDPIDFTKDKTPSLLSPERIAEVLEACLQVDDIASIVRRDSFSYHTAELLDYLEKIGFDRARLIQLELNYLLIHQHQRRPKLLHEDLAQNPKSFVEVLKLIYKPSKDEYVSEEAEHDSTYEDIADENKAAFARLASELLSGWHLLPGLQTDGTVDLAELRTWVNKARELARSARMSVIADVHIGCILAYSPDGSDGAWPHQAVRDLIEELENPTVESAWKTQIVNNRGVTMRRPTDGGSQERSLVNRYHGFANQIEDTWPRTATTLRMLSEDYARQAEGQDKNAELTQDMWR